MAALPIYTYGTSVLRAKAKPVVNVFDETIKLVMDMFETMRSASGIGLAANQVGALQRIVVIDVSELDETKDVKPFVMINPEILSTDGRWTMEEGCLSLPEVRDDVDRAETVSLRYRDTNFEIVQLEARGLLGRVILHEIDHLNGVLFLDHLPAAKRKLHRDRLKAIERGEMEVSYPVVTRAEIPA